MKFQKCSFCGKFKNTPYHITDIVPDGYKSYDLCNKCGESYMNPHQAIDLSHIKTPEALLSLITAMHQLVEEPPPCNGCGLTDAEFEKTGRFGCAKCYAHFKDKLEKYVYPYHKAKRHVGKKPKKQIERSLMADPVEKLKLLKLRLAKAIEVEKFEEAALLKKEIEDHLSRDS